MTQLASAVDAVDKLWTLDMLPPSPYVQVDDELVEIRATFPERIRQSTQEVMPPQIRVRRGVSGTTAASHADEAVLTPVYDPSMTGSTYRIERVTFDMEGLTTGDNPPVPGIRLGDVVVPAGSLVLATVYVPTEFAEQPTASGPTLFPLIRNIDGLTATALVDAPVGVGGSPGGTTNEGITATVDPENSIITTEDTHLGVGIFLGVGFVGVVNGGMNDSTTTMPVSSLSENLPATPFAVTVDNEQMNVTAVLSSPDRFTVQRAQGGTSAAAHDPSAEIRTLELANLVSGEAYIVFWIRPLSGTLP